MPWVWGSAGSGLLGLVCLGQGDALGWGLCWSRRGCPGGICCGQLAGDGGTLGRGGLLGSEGSCPGLGVLLGPGGTLCWGGLLGLVC